MATLIDEFKSGQWTRGPGLLPQHHVILDLIPEGARVLDLGCGEGDLLRALMDRKNVRAEGIEISDDCLQACVAKGVPNVNQGDLDEGLADYADGSIDYVILANTIQVLHRPLQLLQEIARVGRFCVAAFPNFAHWRSRWQLAVGGRMPKTPALPYEWYDTPNIHLTTINDFRSFCGVAGLEILREIPLRTVGDRCRPVRFLSNLLADQAVFVLRGQARD
jgi:methionine biosynthesis protein MetW